MDNTKITLTEFGGKLIASFMTRLYISGEKKIAAVSLEHQRIQTLLLGANINHK
jgi:hypothetical protein